MIVYDEAVIIFSSFHHPSSNHCLKTLEYCILARSQQMGAMLLMALRKGLLPAPAEANTLGGETLSKRNGRSYLEGGDVQASHRNHD